MRASTPPPGRHLRDVIGPCWPNARTTAAGAWLVKVLGWLVTGLAISLGAPFWFGLLNRFVDLRGAGKRPEPVQAPENHSVASRRLHGQLHMGLRSERLHATA